MLQRKPLKAKTPLKRKTPLKAKPYKWKKSSPVRGGSVAAPKRKNDSRSMLMRKADAAFSLYIRTRDSQSFEGRFFRCISCGRVLPIEQADAGHYISRTHMHLRFDENNVHVQCRQCNRFLGGNLKGYREGLTMKIGGQAVSFIEVQKNVIRHFSASDLEAIARFYRSKVKQFHYQIK